MYTGDSQIVFKLPVNAL